MNRTSITAAAVLALAAVPVLGMAGPALAGTTPHITAACATGDGGFCGGLSTAQTPAAAMTVDDRVPSLGSPVETAPEAVSRRQDFDIRSPVNPVNGDKIFQWAPRGVTTSPAICVTGHFAVRSAVTMQRCIGSLRQRWTPVAAPGGFLWINDATGLAMTNASGEVQSRTVGAGTSLNKVWHQVSTPPVS